MDVKYTTTRGHEPLRVPQGWKDQDRALIIQLERILDDIYRRFTTDDVQDLQRRMDEAEEDISSLGGRMTTAEENITSLTTRVGTAEGDITALGTRMGTAEGKITALEGIYGLTVTQLKGK